MLVHILMRWSFFLTCCRLLGSKHCWITRLRCQGGHESLGHTIRQGCWGYEGLCHGHGQRQHVGQGEERLLGMARPETWSLRVWRYGVATRGWQCGALRQNHIAHRVLGWNRCGIWREIGAVWWLRNRVWCWVDGAFKRSLVDHVVVWVGWIGDVLGVRVLRGHGG